MTTYTAVCTGLELSGWIVTPLATSQDPEPQLIAAFDTEAEALAEVSSLNILAMLSDIGIQ